MIIILFEASADLIVKQMFHSLMWDMLKLQSGHIDCQVAAVCFIFLVLWQQWYHFAQIARGSIYCFVKCVCPAVYVCVLVCVCV